MNDATQLRAAQIKRLAGLSNVVAALLGAVDSMYPAQQQDALFLCEDLLNSAASDLSDVMRGAE